MRIVRKKQSLWFKCWTWLGPKPSWCNNTAEYMSDAKHFWRDNKSLFELPGTVQYLTSGQHGLALINWSKSTFLKTVQISYLLEVLTAVGVRIGKLPDHWWYFCHCQEQHEEGKTQDHQQTCLAITPHAFLNRRSCWDNLSSTFHCQCASYHGLHCMLV